MSHGMGSLFEGVVRPRAGIKDGISKGLQRCRPHLDIETSNVSDQVADVWSCANAGSWDAVYNVDRLHFEWVDVQRSWRLSGRANLSEGGPANVAFPREWSPSGC